jgi:hypothetical protein
VNYLRVKNWSEFQHYRDRNPPWIKLHRTLLDDYEFARLQDASKAHLILIWLFASQRDGLVPDDPKFLKMKLGLEREPNLKWFINHGLLIPEQVDSAALADCEQLAPRGEERRGDSENVISGQFARFWSAWPKSSRKASRGGCWRVWQKGGFDSVAEQIIAHVEAMKTTPDWKKEAGAYIPAPLVYLNQRRWEGAEVELPEERRRVAV